MHLSLSAALLVTAVSSCRSEGPVQPVPAAEAAFPYRVEAGSFVFSADPLDDSARVEATFGELVAHRGMLPVRVRLENRSARAAIVRSEDVSLSGAGEAAGQRTTVRRREEGAAEVAAGMLLFGPLGASVTVTQYRIEGTNANARLSQLALLGNTLAPGAATDGFLYFAVPAGGLPSDAVLAWDLPVAGSAEAIRLELPMPLNPAPLDGEAR